MVWAIDDECWTAFKHYVAFALKHYPYRLQDCLADVQMYIAPTGNLKILRWICGLTLNVDGAAIVEAAEFGDLDMLEYLSASKDFWFHRWRSDGGFGMDRQGSWISRAAEYEHLHVLAWSLRKGAQPIQILDRLIGHCPIGAIHWCLARIKSSPELYTYLWRRARKGHDFTLMKWLQIHNGAGPVNWKYVYHVIAKCPGSFGALVKEFVEADLHMRWDTCCMQRLGFPLSSMTIYVFTQQELSDSIEAFEQMVRWLLGNGVPSICGAHPQPMNMSEYREQLIEKGNACIRDNSRQPVESDSETDLPERDFDLGNPIEQGYHEDSDLDQEEVNDFDPPITVGGIFDE